MFRVYFALILFSFFTKAGEFCQLQPEVFEETRSYFREFEQNVETTLTEIYQNEYPIVYQKMKELDEAMKEFEKRDPDEEDWELLKNRVQNLETEVSPLRAPYFLYPPKFSYSIKGSQISYGDLQFEVFFRSPKEDLFRLPFLNIGFETNPNTVIYACIHLNSFDSEKNRVYIYFLNTTKFFVLKWTDLFSEFNLVVRSFLTSGRPPEAKIAPLAFQVNPASNTVYQFLETVDSVTNQIGALQSIGSLQSVSSAMNKLEFLDFTTQINPILALVLNNVDFGIKGVVIHPHRLQLNYAGSALYGLINFNLGQHAQEANFSSFMNVLTWEKEEDEEEDEEDEEFHQIEPQ